MTNKLFFFFNSATKFPKPNAGQSPTFSPPGCATSRLRPAIHMHYFSYCTLTPSAEIHRNSIVWIKPTKIGCRGNVS